MMLAILAVLIAALGLAKGLVLFVVLAAVTVAPYTFDLGPIINGVVVPLLEPVLAIGLLWLFIKGAQLLHINIQAGQRKLLETAFDNALNYAATQLGGAHLVVSTNSQAVSAVASYISKTAPGAVKALGLDKDAQALVAAITARLPLPTVPAPAAAPAASQVA